MRRRAPASRHEAPRRQMTAPEDIMADANKIFKQQQQEEKPPFWKRRRFHFIVGLGLGLLATYGASTTPIAQTHLNELQSYLALQLADVDIASMLPVTDAVDDLFGNFTKFLKPAPSSEIPFMPALLHKEELELKPHFPVVMIPGIVSSGLESWSTSETSRKYFRKRMWGTTTMFRSVLLDKELWTQHMKLDPVTGLDPPGIKLRVAQGLDAADYFVTGYWVWAKVIENLAAIGYDSNNMHFASYDWRLAFSNLEVRDRYFTRLKNNIELSKRTSGRKSVVLSHSMGAVIFPYFLKWAESPLGGNGGETWVEEHIETFVNIAGPMIGAPKALTAMLSGETRDTLAFGSFGAYLLERFFSRQERVSLIRTWAGGSSMLPKGGDIIWGSTDSAPDDEKNQEYHSFGSMISFVDPTADKATFNGTYDGSFLIHNYTVDDAFDLLHHSTPIVYHDQLRLNYSYGITTSKIQLQKNNNDPTKWSNPLESQLPFVKSTIAPSMKIYCLHGVGLPTERSYYYTAAVEEEQGLAEKAKAKAKSKAKEWASSIHSRHMFIDTTMNDPVRRVETGVRVGDGDGTVPLLSLGYLCTPSGGWTKHADLYNPAKIPVVMKQYLHEQPESKLDVRGGSKAGDHIDILGNWEMTLDLLQIVSGKGSNVTERILTNIDEYAENIKLQHEP
ncbi:hypothetical protein EC973_004299 [Apophysomyces ossiformis]|uniref:Phospholipid:diacylglycerol acyltransferase n=1 Tax=Apophysomyces ossiformis TaxID=679940 RepID=A0A8H7BH04_9FUNG|nr:hypothetical protein EC973_004299 [Apophysomyces ossiformis]